MAFNELDLKRIEKAASAFLAERRPPLHIRPQLDFEYRVDNQTVELIEVRPQWDDPTKVMRRPFAKATYFRVRGQWNVYWMRGNLKWAPYETPHVGTIERFFKLVGEDEWGCFFG
jgi:hypothetical protein